MTRWSGIAALAIVLALACYPGLDAGAIAQSPTRPIEEISGPDPVIPPNHPGPREPEPPTPSGVQYEGFQLVGFSSEALAGNRGVLNMTRACAVEYQHSRVCTATEVMQTVETPRVPGHLCHRLAWVLASGAELFVNRNNAALRQRFTQRTPLISDCLGWSTDSSQEYGLAIELGEHQDCYGGFMPASCEQELVVACCAMK